MSVSVGNSKEIFELFTNKQCLKDEESDKDPDLAVSPIDAPLERSASSLIIMKSFCFRFDLFVK